MNKINRKLFLSLSFLLIVSCFVSYKIFRKIKINNSIEKELTSVHWNDRKNYFENEKNEINGIVFLGNSLTERWSFDTIAGKKIINRGISGDFTFGVLERLDQVTKLKPKKVFLEIGINDLVEKVNSEEIVENIKKIIKKIECTCLDTKVYVYSLTPTDLPSGIFRTSKGLNKEVIMTNIKLKEMCGVNNIFYIDIHSFLYSGNKLKKEYSIDGIHLTELAYKKWEKLVIPYILD